MKIVKVNRIIKEIREEMTLLDILKDRSDKRLSSKIEMNISSLICVNDLQKLQILHFIKIFLAIIMSLGLLRSSTISNKDSTSENYFCTICTDCDPWHLTSFIKDLFYCQLRC
jgi:hypothetical protein